MSTLYDEISNLNYPMFFDYKSAYIFKPTM